MWHHTACKISVSLSFFIEIILSFSELMLPTLIQRYDKKKQKKKKKKKKKNKTKKKQKKNGGLQGCALFFLFLLKT